MAPSRISWQYMGILAFLLSFLITITISPYHGNVTTFFHMDQETGKRLPLPHNFVTLTIPGYDGMQYYQIARGIPTLFSPSQWHVLNTSPTLSYSYQRILLPFTAFLLSFGKESLLPWSFLLINITALLLTFAIIAYQTNKALYALALALSPAAMVGLHFSLAEPLTLLLCTAFLLHYLRKGSVGIVAALLLSGLVLAREVNILFVGVFGLFLLLKKQWRDFPLLSLPLGTFIAWHSIIFSIFGEIPFLWSTAKRALPFTAVVELLSGTRGYNVYTLSSLALLLAFVLPASLWITREIVRKRQRDFLPIASLTFLILMLTMPDHIWGSITSIGRVITPVYPLVLLFAARQNSGIARSLASSILILGIITGLGLASIPHPFTLS